MRLIDADALKTKKVRSAERSEWVVPVAEIDWMPTVTADSDTVSRQAVYDTLTEYYHHSTDTQHIALAEAISRVPPSPTPSRPHGQWIRHHEITDGNDIIKGYMCNQCKRVVEVHSWETLNEKYPFCNCGADMRGGKA